MSLGASFGNALRSTGKRAAVGAINKSAKGYGKSNKKVKAAAKKGIAHFKALATKSERNAAKARNSKRAKQVRKLKTIK